MKARQISMPTALHMRTISANADSAYTLPDRIPRMRGAPAPCIPPNLDDDIHTDKV